MDPASLISEVLEEIDYQHWLESNSKDSRQADRRWRNVTDLITWMKDLAQRNPEAALSDIIADLTLMDLLSDNDQNEDGDWVRLMTLHAAKGLEFPCVYLVCMEEGVLPHRQSLDDKGLKEERRLAYVGITRAQRALCLTFTRTRTRYGEIIDTEPSRFFEEVKDADLRWEGTTKSPEESRTQGNAALSQLRAMLAN